MNALSAHDPLLLALAALTGASLGSFLNVCAARWPVRMSVIAPESRCPECECKIRWFENLPILGYLIVRGRCLRCRARLSVQYPVVEGVTALLWTGMAARWGFEWEALRGSLFLTILLGIAIADARTYIIPDQFSLGGAALGIALALFAGGPSPAMAVAGAGLGLGLLWFVAALGRLALGRDAMGGGDIKMMAMGAFVGPWGVLVTLFAGSLLGALIFGPLALRSGRPVPFGIFLALGGGIAYSWGSDLAAWYGGLLTM